MAELFDLVERKYYDRHSFTSYDDFKAAVDASATVYVGNLGFYTREEQVYALFTTCGDIKRIIMGLDRNVKTPCGFCFVEYVRLFLYIYISFFFLVHFALVFGYSCFIISIFIYYLDILHLMLQRMPFVY